MPLTRKGAKLLLKTADLIEAAKDKDFDMASWKKVTLDNRGVCGTTHCALGFACQTPEAKRAGATFERDGIDIDGDTYEDGLVVVGYQIKDNEQVVQRLFGLDPVADDDLINKLFYETGRSRKATIRILRKAANEVLG